MERPGLQSEPRADAAGPACPAVQQPPRQAPAPRSGEAQRAGRGHRSASECKRTARPTGAGAAGAPARGPPGRQAREPQPAHNSGLLADNGQGQRRAGLAGGGQYCRCLPLGNYAAPQVRARGKRQPPAAPENRVHGTRWDANRCKCTRDAAACQPNREMWRHHACTPSPQPELAALSRCVRAR